MNFKYATIQLLLLVVILLPVLSKPSEFSDEDDWFNDDEKETEDGTVVKEKPQKVKAWGRENYCDHEPFTTVILKLILDIQEDMKFGNDSIGMPVLDPLSLPKVEYQFHNNQYKFKLNGIVDKVYVRELSKFIITNIESDLSELTTTISTMIPNLSISGDYSLKGKFASIIPLNGRGRFSLNPKNANCSIFAKLSFGSDDIITLDQFDFKLKVEQLQVDFGGVMGFSRQISGAVNKVFNLLGIRIFNKLEPMMHEKIRNSLMKKINKVFNDWTYDEAELEKMLQLPLRCMFG